MCTSIRVALKLLQFDSPTLPGPSLHQSYPRYWETKLKNSARLSPSFRRSKLKSEKEKSFELAAGFEGGYFLLREEVQCSTTRTQKFFNVDKNNQLVWFGTNVLFFPFLIQPLFPLFSFSFHLMLSLNLNSLSFRQRQKLLLDVSSSSSSCNRSSGSPFIKSQKYSKF